MGITSVINYTYKHNLFEYIATVQYNLQTLY